MKDEGLKARFLMTQLKYNLDILSIEFANVCLGLICDVAARVDTHKMIEIRQKGLDQLRIHVASS